MYGVRNLTANWNALKSKILSAPTPYRGVATDGKVAVEDMTNHGRGWHCDDSSDGSHTNDLSRASMDKTSIARRCQDLAYDVAQFNSDSWARPVPSVRVRKWDRDKSDHNE